MPLTNAQFMDRLRASELVAAEEVEALCREIPPDQLQASAEAITDRLVDSNTLTSYQAQALLIGNADPLVLFNYVVLDRIGAGGMGQVYKARHSRMKRVVALKVLPPGAMRSTDLVRRFQREVEAGARLKHPNIVAVLDAGEAQGVIYFVMEYVAGRDLSARLKQDGPFGIELAIDIALQAARGMAYAHSRGVVHRDLKPGNLLIDDQGTVKILDWGLARLAIDADQTVGEQLTQTHDTLGTLEYMAPEQALDTRSADARSDIYSLGCTLYRLLTGEPVYRADSLGRLLLAHREMPLPKLRDKRPETSLELEAVVWRMIAKQPADRFASMEEVAAALAALSTNENALAPPPVSSDSSGEALQSPLQVVGRTASAAPRGHRKSRDSRWAWIAGGTLAVLVIVAAVWAVVQGQRGTGKSPALGQAKASLGQKPTAGKGDKAAPSVDERRIVEQVLALESMVSVRVPGEAEPRPIKALTDLPQGTWSLTSLHFDSNQVVSDQFFVDLPVLQKLNFVDLSGTQVGIAGLVSLARQTALENVYVGNTKLADAQLAVLAKLPNLKLLGVHGTAVTDRGLRPLAAAARLGVLGLDGRQFTPAAVETINQMPEFYELHLVGPDVRDEHLERAAQLSRLTKLILSDSRVSEASIAKLKAARPTCEVVSN